MLTFLKEETGDDAELTVLKYFISIAELVPSVEVAVALVQTVDCCREWTDDLRETMGKLGYK